MPQLSFWNDNCNRITKHPRTSMIVIHLLPSIHVSKNKALPVTFNNTHVFVVVIINVNVSWCRGVSHASVTLLLLKLERKKQINPHTSLLLTSFCQWRQILNVLSILFNICRYYHHRSISTLLRKHIISKFFLLSISDVCGKFYSRFIRGVFT